LWNSARYEIEKLPISPKHCECTAKIYALTNANSVVVKVVLVSRFRAIGQSSLLVSSKESRRFSHECDLFKDPVRPDVIGAIAESLWRRIGLHLVVEHFRSLPDLKIRKLLIENAYFKAFVTRERP